MKKNFLLTACLCLTLAAHAQQALGPGTGLVSPEIHPDHSVTFRIHAPKAVTVRLAGDFLARPVDLTEGPDGVWSYTTAPLEGEL